MISPWSTPSAECSCAMNSVTWVRANTKTRSKKSSNVVTRWLSSEVRKRGRTVRVALIRLIVRQRRDAPQRSPPGLSAGIGSVRGC
jgi:hypothetical protein